MLLSLFSASVTSKENIHPWVRWIVNGRTESGFSCLDNLTFLVYYIWASTFPLILLIFCSVFNTDKSQTTTSVYLEWWGWFKFTKTRKVAKRHLVHHSLLFYGKFGSTGLVKQLAPTKVQDPDHFPQAWKHDIILYLVPTHWEGNFGPLLCATYQK